MSRKSLVPIQLPADPTQPLEAAPKQYVDLFNEVFVGNSQPADPNTYELWYDPDG